MRYLIVLSALVVSLAASATASAGGWATVGFAPLPDGTAAGETWTPKITVLQHGQTPLGGLSPVVTITADDTHRDLRGDRDLGGRCVRGERRLSAKTATGAS